MSILDDSAFLAKVDAAQKRWALPTVCMSVSVDAGRSVTQWFGTPSSGLPDEDSIICIASNTKFFTAVGLAILVEEGKLRWTDRLVDLVLGLRFVDEETAGTLTLEAALSHQSGLPSSQEADSSQILTVADAVELVSGIRPTQAALCAYQYNNACWYLAGHIIARVSGQGYADFIEQRILQPLGMINSSYGTPLRPEKLVSAAVALPGFGSQEIEHGFVGLSRDSISAPGGRLLSTPADMSIWLRYLTRLYNGALTDIGPHIIRSSTLKEMLRSRVLAGHQIGGVPTEPGQSLFKEMSVPTYALGQYRCHYRGLDMLHHWGRCPGAGSVMLWVPQRNFSLTVWANVDSAASGAVPAIALLALDAHFGFERVDWVERFWALPSGRPDLISRPPYTDASLDLSGIDRYTGTFRAHAYGQLHIFRPSADPAGLPKEAARKLELFKRAKVFGPSSDKQPDLLAVYAHDPFLSAYVAMHAVGTSTFWSQCVEVADLSRVPMAKSDEVVAVPGTIKTFEAVDENTWELSQSWQEDRLEEGKGNATFKRITQ